MQQVMTIEAVILVILVALWQERGEFRRLWRELGGRQ